MARRVLLANGDSSTAGDELPDFSGDPVLVRSQLTWSGVLARSLAARGLIEEYVNVAEGGNSPLAIVRTTIRAVHELTVTRRHSPQELLVAIMWGIPQRMEFVTDAGQWLKVYPSNAHLDYSRLWYRHFHGELDCTMRFFLSILHLQSFLRASGIPYFMLHAATPLIGAGSSPFGSSHAELQWVRDLIDWSAFLFAPLPGNPRAGFLEWAHSQGHAQYPDGHFTETAHAAFSATILVPWVLDRLTAGTTIAQGVCS